MGGLQPSWVTVGSACADTGGQYGPRGPLRGHCTWPGPDNCPWPYVCLGTLRNLWGVASPSLRGLSLGMRGTETGEGSDHIFPFYSSALLSVGYPASREGGGGRFGWAARATLYTVREKMAQPGQSSRLLAWLRGRAAPRVQTPRPLAHPALPLQLPGKQLFHWLAVSMLSSITAPGSTVRPAEPAWGDARLEVEGAAGTEAQGEEPWDSGPDPLTPILLNIEVSTWGLQS